MEHPDAAVVACGRCGAGVPPGTTGVPVTWSVTVVGSARRVLCEVCTRDHVRAIEAKLDEVWW